MNSFAQTMNMKQIVTVAITLLIFLFIPFVINAGNENNHNQAYFEAHIMTATDADYPDNNSIGFRSALSGHYTHDTIKFYPNQDNHYDIIITPGKKKDVFDGEKIIYTNIAQNAEDVQTRMDNKNDDGTYPVLIPLVCNYLPGVSPPIYPEGIGGFRMAKQGAFFINDIHYGPAPADTIDNGSYFNIFFADKPPTRPTYEILLGSLGVAPVKPQLVIPANEIKMFTIDYMVQQDMSVLTINPHMHLIGESFLAYALTPAKDTIPLIKIPKWDFRWQYFYTFKKVLKIPAGSVIHVEGVFDNTSSNPNNPFNPPQVIIDRGNKFDSMKTTNEMLQLIITYMSYKPGDENISLENQRLTN